MPPEPSKSDYLPQANDLDKVLELTRWTANEAVTLPQVTDHFRFDPRQAAYYVEAAQELGLVTGAAEYRATELGTKVGQADEHTRLRLFLPAVLALRSIREPIRDLDKAPNHVVGIADLTQSVARVGVDRYKGETLTRRSECVLSWLRWLENNSEFVTET